MGEGFPSPRPGPSLVSRALPAKRGEGAFLRQFLVNHEPRTASHEPLLLSGLDVRERSCSGVGASGSCRPSSSVVRPTFMIIASMV